jgi:hypothetical protein
MRITGEKVACNRKEMNQPHFDGSELEGGGKLISATLNNSISLYRALSGFCE